jgi:hypothetical protein
MLRKNQIRLCFTDEQENQLKQVNDRLHRFNYFGRRELQGILHRDLSSGEYRTAGDSLGTLAFRMNSELRCFQEILKFGRQQQPDLVVVHFDLHDDISAEKGMKEADAIPVALRPQPALLAEISSLLAVIDHVQEWASSYAPVQGSRLNAFFRQITRLKFAVLKQQQHFQAFTHSSNIRVEFRYDDLEEPPVTTNCDKSMEIDRNC